MNRVNENWPVKLWKMAVKRMEQMRLEIFGAYDEAEMTKRMTLRPVEVKRQEVKRVHDTHGQRW